MPLQPQARYRLFTLAFNLRGGDGYVTLANIAAERIQDIGVLDADLLQAYIDSLPRDLQRDLPVIQPVADAWHSTQSFRGP